MHLGNTITMKHLSISIFCFCFISLSTVQSSSSLDRSYQDTIVKDELEFVLKIADNLLITWKNGVEYQISENEFTSGIIKGFTKERQLSGYKKIRSELGDYVSLEFYKKKPYEKIPGSTVYTLKGVFDKVDFAEVAVGVDKNGKVGSFYVRP